MTFSSSLASTDAIAESQNDDLGMKRSEIATFPHEDCTSVRTSVAVSERKRQIGENEPGAVSPWLAPDWKKEGIL